MAIDEPPSPPDSPDPDPDRQERELKAGETKAKPAPRADVSFGLLDLVLHWIREAPGFVVTAAIGGIIGNRADAAGLIAKRRLTRKLGSGSPSEGEEPSPRLIARRAIHAAINTATDAGYTERRLRCVKAQYRNGTWLVILRVTWSRTVLLIRVPDADPDSCELTASRLPLPRD